MKKYLMAPLILVAVAACGGGDDDGDTSAATTTADMSSEAAQECLDLLQETNDDPDVSACRRDGYDPVWNSIGIHATDEDYEHWRETDEVPTCDDIDGRDNPLGGVYSERDVADCEALAQGEDPPEREGEFDTSISDAAAECGVDDAIGDEGDSITFDTEGADDVSGHDIADVACVLTQLDTPDHVISRMDSTRALDGTVDAEWDGYNAFWTYHPDSGMNITIYTEGDD